APPDIASVARGARGGALAGAIVHRRYSRHERRIDREGVLALVSEDVLRRPGPGARIALLRQKAGIAVVANADVQRQALRQRDPIVEIARAVPLTRRGCVGIVIHEDRIGSREAAVVVRRLVAGRVAGDAAVAVLLLVRIAEVVGFLDVAPSQVAGLQLVLSAAYVGEVRVRRAVLPSPRRAIGLQE